MKMEGMKVKQFLKVLSCFATVIAIITLSVSAAGVNVKYDGGDSEFVFSGKADEARAGQIVTVRITDISDDIVFIRQTATDSDGSYLLKAELVSGVNGDLQATVKVGNEAAETKSLYKSTASEIIATIGKLDAGMQLKDIVTAAEGSDATAINDLKVLMVDASDFRTADADGIVSAVLTNEKPFETTPASINKFMKAYKLGFFLVDVKAATTGEQVLSKMNEYSDYLSAPDKKAKETFDAYDETKKIAILSNLSGDRFESGSAFFDALYEQVVLAELAAAANNNEKFEILKENNDFLLLPLTSYENLSTQFETFKTELFTLAPTSVSTLKSKCAELYTKHYGILLENSGGSGGGGSSGGGGGSVGGGMISNPLVDSGLIPTPDPTGESYFNDLAGYEWAIESIHNLAKKGIVNGKADKVFAPGDNVTRAEFVKLLIGALGITSDSNGADFKDIPQGHWAYDFVRIASANNIVNGINDGYYGADEKISRQDMAVMCFRALEYADGEIVAQNETSFADDNKISDYAKKAVAALSKMGVINGKGNNIFDPQNVATRAEAAKVIYSLLGR